MYSVEEIQDIIKQAGLKATQQRIILFKMLTASAKHPTVDWLYDQVKKDYPSMSLATVYKTMESFVEAGIVKKVKSEDGKNRYDGNTEKHNHIYCEQTGRIFDFKDSTLQEVVEAYLQEKKVENFEINDIQVQISGRMLNPDKPVHYKT